MSLQNIKTYSKASDHGRTVGGVIITYHDHIPAHLVLNENQMMIESVGVNINPIDIENY